MAYNPNHLVHPDNPRSAWCEYCGDQIFPGDDDYEQMANGDYVHTYCMTGYANGLLFKIKGLHEKIEEYVGKDFS